MRGARYIWTRAAAVTPEVCKIFAPAFLIVVVDRQIWMIKLARADRPVSLLPEELGQCHPFCADIWSRVSRVHVFLAKAV